MRKSPLFSISGTWWFFHPFGTGLIFSYNTKSMVVQINVEATGFPVSIVNMSQTGGYKSPDEFKQDCIRQFEHLAVFEKIDLNHNYLDEPKIVGNVTIDFSLFDDRVVPKKDRGKYSVDNF